MKSMNMKLFAVLALFGMSSVAFGYTFSFNNKTDQPVTVVVKERTIGSSGQEAVIQPNAGHAFAFAGLYCLKDITINGQVMSMKDISGVSEAVCKDQSFDITGSLGTQAVNFKLSAAR